MLRKIYIASSWKNKETIRSMAWVLRKIGHEVFDFTDPESRPEGFDCFTFSASEWARKPKSQIEWKEFMELEATRRAFESDKAGLDWADTIIMLNPCGRNAHLEAGYAIGKGKDLFIYGDLPIGEFEAMYFFANKGLYRSREFINLIEELDGSFWRRV